MARLLVPTSVQVVRLFHLQPLLLQMVFSWVQEYLLMGTVVQHQMEWLLGQTSVPTDLQ